MVHPPPSGFGPGARAVASALVAVLLMLARAARPAAGGLHNATALGANATVGASNSLALGGTGIDAVSVGIGTASPRKRLHVVNGDTFLDSVSAAAGIIVRASDNSAVRKRLTVNQAGALSVATVTCP